MDARLIVDGPAAGAWNMAVDEALLESAGESGTTTLRFYEWSEPTVSLGYFQSVDSRRQHPGSLECPLVRRTTGGGAIVHHHELTYSLSAPSNAPLFRDPRALYQIVHGALVEVLAAHGICAELAQRANSHTPAAANEPFLCFQRRAEGDVLVAGNKVCGSAQRKHRQAILQHGSILLAASSAAPELPGVNSFVKSQILPTQLGRQLWTRLSSLLGLNWIRGKLTPAETALAGARRDHKFSAAEWTGRT